MRLIRRFLAVLLAVAGVLLLAGLGYRSVGQNELENALEIESPTADEQMVQRDWGSVFEGSGKLTDHYLRWVLLAPRYSLGDVRSYLRGVFASQAHFYGAGMKGPLWKVNLAAEDPAFRLPIFILQGATDSATPTELARSYFDAIRAPHKEFVAIEGTGHAAVIMHAGEFLQLLTDRVRPVADAFVAARVRSEPLESVP